MRVGVLGGGQLGRMLGQAALPLGVKCTFLEGAPAPSAAPTGDVIAADYDDAVALRALAEVADVVTWEFENVPVAVAERLAEHVALHPPPRALEMSQDRLTEKRFLSEAGVGVAPHAAVDDEDSLRGAVAQVGLPAVLKTRRMGYDGKGQHWVRTPADVPGAHAALGGVPCILEGAVPFTRELSVIAARGRDGQIAVWPLVENHHQDGILRWSVAPAPGSEALQDAARRHVTRLLTQLDYVGVIAVEFFEVSGELIANEIAPRVHNSGHWTIEGSVTSQFENHLRAVLGWPLGSTDVSGRVACVNLIGEVPAIREILRVPGARLHLYGKSPRPGRKLGHVTVVGPQVDRSLEEIRRLAGC